jgi:DNA-damage-inducible protein J
MSIIPMKNPTSMRLDEEAKQEASKVFEKLGLTMGQAVNLFLYQVMLTRGLPFDVKIPNEETQKAIEETSRGENLEEFSLDELEHS